ncbi:MAG: PorP/SprF family type IX secretion system membrane protein [Salinivirgaceae bacterium]
MSCKPNLFIRVLFLVGVMGIGMSTSAQDNIFSQFHNHPNSLNPSLTALRSCGRLYTNYRHADFGPLEQKYMGVAFDIPFSETYSGFGGMLYIAEEGVMQTGSFSAQFSRKIAIVNDVFFTLGMEAGGVFRRYNQSRLILPSDVQMGTDGGSNVELPSSLVFDMSVGAGLNYRNHFIGFATHHLTETGLESIYANSQLYRRFTLHYASKFTYSMPGRNDGYYSPQLIIDKQKGNNQATMGVYGMYNSVGAGAWVRTHFPFNVSFFVLMGTIKTKNMQFSYSYDFPVNGTGLISGAHEISIIYYISDFKEKYHKLNQKNCLSF